MRRRLLRRVGDPQPDRVSQLLSDEGGVLDTTEQAELVRAFEAAHAAQSRLWRLAFAAVGAVLGCALVWFGVDQARRPWVGYRHHSGFHRTAPAPLVAAAEVLSGTVVLAAAAVLSARVALRPAALRKRTDEMSEGGTASQWLHWESLWALRLLSLAMGLALFWAWAICESLRRARVTGPQAANLLWLPGGPVGYAGLVVVFLRMLRSTEADLVALRENMYVFHKA